MPIIDMQRRLAETGRIRIGETEVGTSTRGKPYKRPKKLEAFRLTSANHAALVAVANLYGGEVHEWADAPTGKQWELFTPSSTLRVFVPPEAMSYSVWYELWAGGGCERRCDGQTETISGFGCLCDPDGRECKPHTRLAVMLADVPSAGMWRLDTQGYYAATELAGAFDLAQVISVATGRAILPGVLRLDQREIKRPNQTLKRFVVPVLEFDVDLNLVAGGTPVAIESRTGLTPIPPGDDEPTKTLADQFHDIENPATPKPRANAAEPVKTSGIRPTARGQVREDEDDDDQDPALLEELHTAFSMLSDEERDKVVPIFEGLRLPRTMNDWDDGEIRKGLAAIRGVVGVTLESGESADVIAPPVTVTEGTVKADEITPPKATRNKITQLNMRFEESGFGDRAIIHDYASKVTKREIKSLNDLTTAEANLVIQQLTSDAGGV